MTVLYEPRNPTLTQPRRIAGQIHHRHHITVAQRTGHALQSFLKVAGWVQPLPDKRSSIDGSQGRGNAHRSFNQQLIVLTLPFQNCALLLQVLILFHFLHQKLVFLQAASFGKRVRMRIANLCGLVHILNYDTNEEIGKDEMSHKNKTYRVDPRCSSNLVQLGLHVPSSNKIGRQIGKVLACKMVHPSTVTNVNSDRIASPNVPQCSFIHRYELIIVRQRTHHNTYSVMVLLISEQVIANNGKDEYNQKQQAQQVDNIPQSLKKRLHEDLH